MESIYGKWNYNFKLNYYFKFKIIVVFLRSYLILRRNNNYVRKSKLLLFVALLIFEISPFRVRYNLIIIKNDYEDSFILGTLVYE